MDRSAVIELYRQIWEGEDIPPPASLLRNIKLETAVLKLPRMPYSILTNLEHADFWQRIWLDKLKGMRAESFMKDWRVPADTEWKAVKASFLQNFQSAMRLAASEPFEHKMKSDEVAVKTLLQLAIHSSYHLGQVNLLKRELRVHTGQPDPN
ncbi:MAG: hypothetical protein WAO58_10785 [Fimbriimonadaceae bacterium]